MHNDIIPKKFMVFNKDSNKYDDPYKGLYLITKVWINGSVTICCSPYNRL